MIVANHPFGIGDGIAVLSLAEQLGRPFRVMIHADLLKIREMEPYSLPIDFSETKEALKNNLAVRHEAVRLLKEGVTIVVFPAGGVATAPKGFGRAQDLPWKMFPARLVQEAKASVIPMHFSGPERPAVPSGQRPDEHGRARRTGWREFVGKVSLTLRTVAADPRIRAAVRQDDQRAHRQRRCAGRSWSRCATARRCSTVSIAVSSIWRRSRPAPRSAGVSLATVPAPSAQAH